MLQKPLRIAKYGNSCVVTIPRAVMFHCGFEIGDLLLCEVTESKTILYRPATGRDFLPERIRKFLPYPTIPSP